ncbi:hypothetical protein I3843_01G067200 [Carya illinoinensis]|nr:hypothetical protein I3843_01G067200 [Carya illinoinensis]KAG7994619.1 hypothetical protein I3843_01G067200 [Carya illinoinensis]
MLFSTMFPAFLCAYVGLLGTHLKSLPTAPNSVSKHQTDVYRSCPNIKLENVEGVDKNDESY